MAGDGQQVWVSINARKQGEHLSSVTEQEFGSVFPVFVFFLACFLFFRENKDRKLFSYKYLV